MLYSFFTARTSIYAATAKNRLCQWLAGEDAAEINYHGMKPGNVDALAREAARVV